MRPRGLFALLFAGLLARGLCHLDILWAEESYPAAAAIQMLFGKTLYRDIWFDKPPLSPGIYLLWGAWPGWPLRLAGALYALLACAAIYRFARELWGTREAAAAAAMLAFYLTFGIPAAVMALAPDLLLIAPHLCAVWLAWRGNAFASGVVAGVAFLINAKAAFVLVACLVFAPAGWVPLLAGFAIPNLLSLAWLAYAGSLTSYYQQVWQWGALYARDSFIADPFSEGAVRTLNWIGFQLAAVIGSIVFFVKDRERWRFAAWLLLSLAAVCAGWRFFPRYYFQILPIAVLLGARGYVLLGRRRWILVAALLIPLVRFGPRYVTLAGDLLQQRPHSWSDLRLAQDSKRSVREGTLLVWGYRPEVWVYSRDRAASRFLDSQPLTGVIADRHLRSSDVAAPERAAENRKELVSRKPEYIIDGLGPLNPALTITNYPDLRDWLQSYRVIGGTATTVIYERAESVSERGSPESRARSQSTAIPPWE